jgi:hypothetical protein
VLLAVGVGLLVGVGVLIAVGVGLLVGVGVGDAVGDGGGVVQLTVSRLMVPWKPWLLETSSPMDCKPLSLGIVQLTVLHPP